MPQLDFDGISARIPIIQGGMAVRVSLSPLAAAVAAEGGIGVIAASGLQVDEVVFEIREARRLLAERCGGAGIIGVNIMVAVRNFADLVRASIAEGVDLIIAGAGFSRDLFRLCSAAGVAAVPIVSSARLAVAAEKAGADAIVVEAKEAGGHLGTDEPLWSLLPKVVAAVKTPVIAAGGILHGWDIRKALDMGAAGVQMATRFAASVESSVADSYKQTYVDSHPEDVVLINSPVGLPGRALRTNFVRMVEEGQAPRPGDLSRCEACLKHCRKDYCIIEHLRRAQQGDMETGLVFCGERVGEIHDVLTVHEIVARLESEYEGGPSAARDESGAKAEDGASRESSDGGPKSEASCAVS
jgi:nitronate monooxygenase